MLRRVDIEEILYVIKIRGFQEIAMNRPEMALDDYTY